jgi:4-hydroxybenzoate polyprenyltransferase
LLASTLFIAIGGYVVNDIYDVVTDSINKPDRVWIPKLIKKRHAFVVYIVVTFVGLILGLYLVTLLGNLNQFSWFVFPVVLLYIYAVWAKKRYVIGNVLVSFLVSYSLFIVVLFNSVSEQITPFVFEFQEVITLLVFFAFVVNLLREIVKDAEDVMGDKAIGAVSIPIRFGFAKTNSILGYITLLPVSVVIAVALYVFKTQMVLSLYLVFGVLMSFMLFLNQITRATKSSHYKTISMLLKLVMLVGVLSVFMIFPNP